MASDRRYRPLLLVDDDPDIRAAVSELLQAEGFEVVEASNGQEGLARLAQMARPCLILLDTDMPIMSGVEFLTHLRANPELSACKVVLLTARHGDLPLGADAVFGRPFDLEDLLELIQRLCPHD